MKYRRYPAYKDSGVEWLGEIPCGWSIIKLDQFSSILTNKSDSQICPVALENIESWSGRYLDNKVNHNGVGISFQPGDILFGKLRPYLAKVWLAEFAGIAMGDFIVLRPHYDCIPGYLKYLLLNQGFIDTVNGSSYGAKMPRAAWSYVGSIFCSLPSVNEQQAVVNFLNRETSKMDALIKEYEDLMALLKEKRSSFITRVVTKGLNPNVKMKDSGVEWLGEIPDEWSILPLKRLLAIQLEYGASEEGSFEQVDDAYRYIRITDIDDDGNLRDEKKYLSHEIANKYRLEPEDVLLARSGATVGKATIVKREWGNCCFAGYLIRARFNLSFYLPRLFRYYTQSTPYWNHIALSQSQSTIPNVNAEKYNYCLIPVPSIKLQAIMVDFLDKNIEPINSLLKETEASITLLKERRSALITAAVTGKIDVRDEVPA